MSNDYSEGAKALLDLKKKDNTKRKLDFPDDKKDDSSRDVEAAVMKYVAGDLDNSGETGNHSNSITSKKRKKSFNNDDGNEFQHWNSFLDTEQLQNADDEPQSAESQLARSDKKKNKKQKRKGTIDVDPELANIDDTTDHEQLVRAAIMDANQMAQDVSASMQQYIQHPSDSQELANTIIQAAETAQDQVQGGGAADQLAPHKSEPKQLVSKPGGQDKSAGWARTPTTKARSFNKQEIEAIDKFLIDFCAIHGLNRRELCERIWANERKREVLWDLLHQVLPGRTRASIYKHVRRSYHIFEVRGKWSAEDDETLARLSVEKSKSWKEIGVILGRMPEDCRDRYRNYIKCGNNRSVNKWTPEEEEKLSSIVRMFEAEQREAGISVPTHNWTIISEKMGGARSRIQCRYKWGKLLKREALQRADKLVLDDKVWLLSKIQELGQVPPTDEDWAALAAQHPKTYWNGEDFKVAFTRMKASVRDKKNKDINDICQVLLQEAIQEAHRNGVTITLPVVLQHFDTAKQEDVAPNAENIANAAINNSTRGNEDYVTWR